MRNGDIRDALTRLAESPAAGARSLSEFLRALHSVFSGVAAGADLPVSDLLDLLTRALEAPAPPFDPAWRQRAESVLLSQIVDLHDLEARGDLARSDRHFGIDAPSGERWYNFTVGTFLEAAAAFMFPEEDDVEVPSLSSAQVKQFFRAGQMYE